MDELQVYTNRYASVFKFEQDGDDQTYGDNINVKAYTDQTQVDNQALTIIYGQNLSLAINSNQITVQPESGILITSDMESSSTFGLGSSLYMPNLSEIIWPFPSLDSQAGQSFPMYTIKDSIKVDEGRFNDQFGYVVKSQQQIHKFAIVFLVLMIVMALVFLALLGYYCSRLKNVDEIEDDSHEAIINQLLEKY